MNNFTISKNEGYVNITNFIFGVDTLSAFNYSKYLWDFGDGVRSREKNPTHFYTNPSSYKVTLNAYDSVASATNTFNVVNNGTGNYVINGAVNPTLTLAAGQTYTFNIVAVGHPFWIKTTQTTGTANAYNNGITNNGTANGTITFTVPSNAPSTLYYICQFHGSMVGTLNIINASYS